MPRKAQQRGEVLRLSSRGWKVEQIAEYFKWSEETVRRTINRWKKEGFAGLEDKKRTGRPTKWKEEDLAVLEKKLESERSYSSRQLKEILRKERQVTLSERQMRRILKKKITCGREQECQ
jgi:transposase